MGNGIMEVKKAVRWFMARVARELNEVSNGKITPDGVTWFGFVMHLPIAILIAKGDFWWAAIFLIVFGLFDTLDGELARLQKTSSPSGMLLDASTDRMKEVLLYAGAAYYLSGGDHPMWAMWAVLALGASLSVSYVKAKGEAAVASGDKKIEHHVLNRMFSDGLLTFEIRMALLVVGLITGLLHVAIVLIALGAGFTAFQRLHKIRSNL